MSEKPYNEPRLALNRIYTRTGDDGTTGLLYGGRVAKDSPMMQVTGAVDEAQAAKKAHIASG